MVRRILKVAVLICLNPNCMAEWFPRKMEKPKWCPRCGSIYWSDPKHWRPK